MPERSRPVRVVFLCLVAAAILAGVASPRAGAQSVAGKRAEAAALQEKISEQGQKLSLADEEFNKARIQRQRIDGQAAAAKDDVAAAESRWVALRKRLGERVRLLYMHPGAALDAWLGASSMADLARAHKLGASVLTADTQLVLKTERARQEVMARAKRLDGIQASAASKEAELASRRTEVSEAVAGQRALLRNVNGEIAALMEAERQRELELARRRAAQSQPEDTGDASPPLIGDDGPADDDEEEQQAPPEPTGPPPAVKAGASKAVSTAAAQIGKPYEWAAEGPDSYDCSGLTMYAWAKGGVSLPHSSQAQFSSLPHVAKSQLAPGDLVFFGSPIHHVGIYEGGGVMINAPETGENVRRDSINRADWAGAARP